MAEIKTKFQNMYPIIPHNRLVGPVPARIQSTMPISGSCTPCCSILPQAERCASDPVLVLYCFFSGHWPYRQYRRPSSTGGYRVRDGLSRICTLHSCSASQYGPVLTTNSSSKALALHTSRFICTVWSHPRAGKGGREMPLPMISRAVCYISKKIPLAFDSNFRPLTGPLQSCRQPRATGR